MPCFKGLAVSIHTPDGPIAEHSIQKQSRASRISSYIPVPPAKVRTGSVTGKPEQSTFAISITLLTPGLNVPYSSPKPTSEHPFPRPRTVGDLPGTTFVRGKYSPAVSPYHPRTSNANETVAAYIYFDGRAKEEVATLLRKGEETWVNSRWVSVPESEGGGLAEREFLFREVGLERWLNGLDLEGGKDKAARIEKRHRKMEKKRPKKKEGESINGEGESKTEVLGDGGLHGSPVQPGPLEIDSSMLSSSTTDSEDEPPQPEAAGQIKVALFRVLASGEIKKGEYSPQFDAHDDDVDQNGDNTNDGADIDHTTSFAKPKSLDPKTISTQTVTGLDPPESPYAVFTFFYRGEKQLRKMGILASPDSDKSAPSSKRKPPGPDFSKLGPLKATGTVGYTNYRDTNARRKSEGKNADAMDSDADDEEDDEKEPNDAPDHDIKPYDGKMLSVEDARRQGELAEGVQKIKLKRQHSYEPLSEMASARKSPHLKTDDASSVGTPKSTNSTSANAGTPPGRASPLHGPEPSDNVIGSPYKRQRGSVSGLDNNLLGLQPLEPVAPTSHPNSIRHDQSSAPSSAPDVTHEANGKMDEEGL